MRRRLGLLLLALLLAGCSTPAPAPAPIPVPQGEAAKSAPQTPVPPASAPTLSDLQAKLAKADSLLVASKNREAVTLLIETVSAHPDSPGAWDLLTLALVRHGAPNAAITAGARAVRLQPESATIRFNLGLAYYRSFNWAKAITHLREAVRLNPVSPDPQLFLARAEAGEAVVQKDQASLTAIRTRFAKDPEIERFQAALDMRNHDLDGDGISEQVKQSTDQLTVTNGRDGTVYLSLPITLKPGQGSWLFGLLGDGIDRFFLLNLPPGGSMLWHFDGHRLVRVNADIGINAAIWRDREVEGQFPGGANSHSKRFTWLEGRLLDLGRFPASVPMQDATDLFIAVSADSGPEARAFADLTLRSQIPLPRGTDVQVFLLPQPSGAFRLEVWEDGARTAAAKVTLNKTWQIEKLDWE